MKFAVIDLLLLFVLLMVVSNVIYGQYDDCVQKIKNARNSIDCFTYDKNVHNEGSVPEVLCKCGILDRQSAMVVKNQQCLFKAARAANYDGTPNLFKVANEFGKYLQGEAKRHYRSAILRCSVGFPPAQQIINCIMKRLIAVCPKDRILGNDSD